MTSASASAPSSSTSTRSTTSRGMDVERVRGGGARATRVALALASTTTTTTTTRTRTTAATTTTTTTDARDKGKTNDGEISAKANVTSMVKEEKTKLVLPGSVERGGAALALRAIAARAKSFAGIKVNVYAIGIYLNDGDVREAMRAVHGKGADMGKVGKTSDALGALERCERAARLVFARDVGGDKIADALRERIALKLGGNSASLKQFEGLFKGVSFQRGATLDFHAKRSGALETSIRGKVIGTIADRALANALFDAYLGNDPVVPSLKEQVRAYVSGIRL